MTDLMGADGVARCMWGNSTPDYADYHDKEWGVPLHGEDVLYERLTLESFQSGLSWLTILRKREAFRKAFKQFKPAKVARFGDADVERLMQDASIVRNRAKILAAITFAPASHPRPRTMSDVPAVTDDSKAMAKELKKRGFAFLGPTTCYALMQATGMVDDHVEGCFRAV